MLHVSENAQKEWKEQMNGMFVRSTQQRFQSHPSGTGTSSCKAIEKYKRQGMIKMKVEYKKMSQSLNGVIRSWVWKAENKKRLQREKKSYLQAKFAFLPFVRELGSVLPLLTVGGRIVQVVWAFSHFSLQTFIFQWGVVSAVFSGSYWAARIHKGFL